MEVQEVIDHSRRVYDSVLGLLSNVDNPTPMVQLSRLLPFEHTKVYAKLEWNNPFGAVKDRVAWNMIQDGEESGRITSGQKLVEPTSGNTGLALAMVSNAKGYSLTTPLSNQIPVEKRTVLRLAGVDVVELEDSLCPAPGAPEGAIARAKAISEEPDVEMLNQYANGSNPEAHYRTTGPEVWHQTGGKITHFVAGLGTCGTINGSGRFLKEQDAEVQILGVYPPAGHDIPGVRSLVQLDQTELFTPDEYDGLVEVDNDSAFEMCQRINQEESLTAGPSSGMALAGALKAVPDEPGNVVVVIFPDSIFKYSSSVLNNVAGLGAAPPSGTKREQLLDSMIENARANPDLVIDVDAAHNFWHEEKPLVIDVREPGAHSQRHIPGAINMPLDELPVLAEFLPEKRDAPLLSVCERGNLSLSGVLFLKSLGYQNVRSITGGTEAWDQNGFTVTSA